MLRNHIVILTLILAFSAFAQGKQLTLQECVKTAFENNPDLKMKAVDFEIAREEAKQSEKERLPAIGFSGSYRRQSTIPEFKLPTIQSPFGGAAITLVPEGGIKLGSLDTYDFRLTMTQPVFTGFRLKNRISASKARTVSKQYEVKAARAELVYKVETAYANVQKAKKFLQIAQTGSQQVKKHLEDVENYVRQGLARRSELLAVKVKLAEAELNVVKARNGLQLAVAALENVIGIQIEPGTEFADFVPDAESIDLQASVQQAMQEREEIKTFDFALQASRMAEKIVSGQRYPALSAFASYGYGRPGLDFIKNEWMDYWIVGVGAQWDLWNWGKTRSQIQQTKLQSRKLLEAEQQVRLAIRLDVTQACLKVQEARERLELTKQMQQQAEEAFRVTENSFQQGQATNAEYLDAQLDLTRAKLRKAEAEIDYALSLANWRRAVGINNKKYE